ncbi:hypothetical protein [Helicobacter canis]|uniref:Glycosyltransferase RgtA/B/C/D-like domain-containing protein n=1 Tax=Helicobacter canis NCTC 12740 TaxID=1357399 RepID=V8CEM8_9HELI|nr:hypothetical protein [Helicobacter canis]ETD25878.1 hypothetical protein HMPREF2087_01712 [Helicobacter canis NCTC 12740]
MSFNLDDALIFFNIIESKPIYWGIDHFDKGRFYPLAFMDLNLLMRLFPTSDILTAPRIYFFVNAVAFALLTCVLLYLLMQIVPLSYSVLALLICFVNLGFVIVFMGVCFPERVQVVWLSGYILGLFFLAHKQKRAGLWALVCIVCGGASMFYKEPDCIFICGSLAVFIGLRFYYGYKSSAQNKCVTIPIVVVGLALGLIACAFMGLYLWLVVPNIQKSYANFGLKNLQVAKDMINAIMYHPFLFLFAPAVLAVRVQKVLQALKTNDKKALHTSYAFYDALLIAALAYGASFFVLMIFTPYYFFPCYVMALLPVAFYTKMYYAHLRKLFIVVVLAHIFVNVPSALSRYTSIKLLPPHYLQATQFLADYTRANTGTNIVMLGQGSDPLGRVFYGYLEWFVRYFDGKDFTLASPDPTPIDSLKSGDLLYLDSYTQAYITPQILARLDTDYEVIFSSSYAGFYDVGLKSLTKYLLLHYAPKYAKSLSSSNIFNAPLGVYIYRVR